jgi:hypothetical protein
MPSVNNERLSTNTHSADSLPPPLSATLGNFSSFLSLLKDVTVPQLVGDFKDATEWNGRAGNVSRSGREAVRKSVPLFARHLRDARQEPSRYERCVRAFSEDLTHNLNTPQGADWAPMSTEGRRFILMQRIVEEACAHPPSVTQDSPRVDLQDFSEVLAALLEGSEENLNAFKLAMMHQVANRDSEGPRRSGLGRCAAHGPSALEEIREHLFRPLVPYLDESVRRLLGL